MSNKIVVTGGAGFIGSHTCKALKAAGYSVIIYDNFSTSNYRRFLEVKDEICDLYRTVDLTRYPELKSCLLGDKPDAVIHFAASAYVGESVAYPTKYYHNNIISTNNLASAMVAAGTKYIVFSSSCATYGIPKNASSISERNSQNPVNPYGRTKLVCEQLLDDCDKAHGIKNIALRYFNAAGSDPSGLLGEDHDPETHLIPNVINALVNDGTIEVYGNSYATTDGTCVRDYIHVNDLADAHIKALEHLFKTNKSNQFNIGTGKGSSVLEIIELAKKITNKDALVKISAARAGDPPILVANATKAQSVLGWSPKFTVAGMITHAYNYHINKQSKDTE